MTPEILLLTGFVFPVNSMVKFHVWLGLVLLDSQLVVPAGILMIKC